MHFYLIVTMGPLRTITYCGLWKLLMEIEDAVVSDCLNCICWRLPYWMSKCLSVLYRFVNIEVAIIADKLSLLLFDYRQCYRRYFWKEVSMKYRRYFFWLEILIKITDTLRWAAASTCASRYRGARP